MVRSAPAGRPPGAALFGTDTSGRAADYILYSGLEVLPIGGYLGNVPSPTLATLQADINSGYLVVFVLPVSPPGSDSRVRWLESHRFRELRAPNLRPIPYASFVCGGVASSRRAEPLEHANSLAYS